MSITVRDIFEDGNSRLVICFDSDSEWVRMRLTHWQAACWIANVFMRKVLGLSVLPVWIPSGAELETGRQLREGESPCHSN